MTYVDAEVLLADVRRKKKRAEEVARRARLKLGVPKRTATRKKVRLSAEQRAVPTAPSEGHWRGSSPARARRT
jgi:hypothetical protein